MADKLMEQPRRRAAFAEGVARLDAIARPLDQRDETLTRQGRTSAVNPDEAWNRQFMSMGIGPDAITPPAAPLARPVVAPQQELAPTPDPVLPRGSGKSGRPLPIGAAIGKPLRRSFLKRLFEGR